MSQQQRTEIIAAILNPKIYYSLVFTSPEVPKEDFMIGMMSELSKQKRLHIVAVDEAHCIDLWGGSFRASFRHDLHKRIQCANSSLIWKCN